MSKFDKKCSKCKNYNVNILICESCAHYNPKLTVFEHITQSMEALAEKMVYHVKEKADSGTYNYWRSTISCDVWLKKSEAVAATIEELKKEYNKNEFI